MRCGAVKALCEEAGDISKLLGDQVEDQESEGLLRLRKEVFTRQELKRMHLSFDLRPGERRSL